MATMGWMNTDTKMDKLKQLQGQIVKNVTLVQDRTAKILQEQERDLLRAFRARLFDIQTELEKEKSKKEDENDFCLCGLIDLYDMLDEMSDDELRNSNVWNSFIDAGESELLRKVVKSGLEMFTVKGAWD
jgi:hypothetical protein